MIWGLQHDCTVKSTPPLSNAVTSLSPLTNMIWRVIMCAPRLHPTTVGCHTVSSVGVCDCRSHVSEDARKHLSLLTSSVCLAACLIVGVCPAKGRRRGARCQAQSCCCKSKTNMHLWYQHTYSSKCCKSLKRKECRSCLGSSELKSSLCFPLTSTEMDDVSPFPPIV